MNTGLLFWARKKPLRGVHTHSLFLIPRRSLQSQYSEARTAWWTGPWTWSGDAVEVPGSITFLGHVGKACSSILQYFGMSGDTLETLFGRVGVTFWSDRGHFFVIFLDVLESVWEWSGYIFRQVLEGFEKNVQRGPEIEIFKNGWEYFP